MQVTIRHSMFVDEKEFFVNEKGKKYTHLGFDEIKEICYSSFLYRLGDKLNVVSRVFVQMNKHKDAYIQPAIYNYIVEFPSFFVLFRKGNLEGVKIVFKNDKIVDIPNGKLAFFEREKYAVIIDNSQTYFVYSTDEGTELVKTEKIAKSFCSINCQGKRIKTDFSIFYVENILPLLEGLNEQNINIIIGFLKLLLAEDIKNYNKPTNKYVLKTTDNLVVNLNKNKDINELQLGTENVKFNDVLQAENNANAVLKFYSTKLSLLLVKFKSSKNNPNVSI